MAKRVEMYVQIKIRIESDAEWCLASHHVFWTRKGKLQHADYATRPQEARAARIRLMHMVIFIFLWRSERLIHLDSSIWFIYTVALDTVFVFLFTNGLRPIRKTNRSNRIRSV